MPSPRLARTTGVFFLLAFVSAIAGVVLYGPVLRDPGHVLGPGADAPVTARFVVGIGNGLLLGYALYRSGLVPRRMTLLGLLGGPLMSLSGVAVLFGLYDQSSWWSGLATLPEIAWEASLGLYLTISAFRAWAAVAPPPV